MSLRNDEIVRLKRATGFNVVGIGAEAYALEGYVALFDRAIQPYLIDPSTTSTTTIAASSSGSVATITLTLASNPTIAGNSVQSLAFTQGSTVTVDVGPFIETAVILSLSGLVATMQLALAHGPAAYPIVVTGAEAELRKLLARFDNVESVMASDADTAGVEQIDKGDVRFFPSARGSRGRFDELMHQREGAARDIAAALGIPYLPDVRRSGGQSYEAY